MAERNGTHVFAWIQGQGFARAGFLVIEEEGEKFTRSQFQYDPGYLKQPGAYALDLKDIPLSAGRRVIDNAPPRPLFGGFLDRLPDNWGQTLLNQMAAELRLPCRGLDMIVAGSEKRIGALGFGATREGPDWNHPLLGDFGHDEIELEDFMEALRDYETRGFIAMPRVLKACLTSSGSPVGGARPKALVNVNSRPVVAKFKAQDDTWKSPCRIEHATMTLATKLGMRVPDAKLIRVGDRDVFALERFDRAGPDRFHILSASSLVGATQGFLGLGDRHSYQEITDALSIHGSAAHLAEDRKELFRRMVFNILANNADDHLRNHSIIHTADGWRLTPLYDVMPDETLTKHLQIGIGSRDTLMSLSNAISAPEAFGIGESEARSIVEEMTGAFRSSWQKHFEECGVPGPDMDRLKILLWPAERKALEDDPWILSKLYSSPVQVPEDLTDGMGPDAGPSLG